MREDITGDRLNIVRSAWESLDRQGLNQVSITDMLRSYNAATHPAVEDGRHTNEEAAEEFESTFLYKHKDAANPDWCTF